MVRRTVDKATGQVVQQVSDAPEPLVHDGQQVANSFGPEYRMLLIGAGQLSEYLATMALFNGFAVTVCDPREEYSRHWSVAGVQLSREMRSEEHTSELQSQSNLVCRLLLEKKKSLTCNLGLGPVLLAHLS